MTYGIGEVIYPRIGLAECSFCGHASDKHCYVVVDEAHMAPRGCDGVVAANEWRCPCSRYVAPAEPGVAKAHSGPPVEVTWARYPNDAVSILKRSEASPDSRCRQPKCQMPIWWHLTAAGGRRCPFDVMPDGTRTGTSHWRTCKDRPVRGRK